MKLYAVGRGLSGFTKKLLVTCVIAAGVSSPALAALDLTNAKVTATLVHPNQELYNKPFSAVVGAGIEFAQGTFAPAYGSFDITSNSIAYFTNVTGQYDSTPFNGYRLDFEGYTGSLSDLVFSSAKSTFKPFEFYVDGNSVFMNVSGQYVENGQYATYDALAPVPEPGEWAMLIAGLGVVGWAARKRQSRGTLSVA